MDSWERVGTRCWNVCHAVYTRLLLASACGKAQTGLRGSNGGGGGCSIHTGLWGDRK